jgi:LTXXQ motif family protein
MRLLAAAMLGLFVGSAAAQDHQHKHAQPYAGINRERSIKALSDQEIADLRAGRGMRLALAAELNGYPGPLHVLELAGRLGLSPDQRQEVQRLYDTMRAEAIAVGEQLIDAESKLDRAFKDRTISPESLAELSAAIARRQGDLRAVHLKFHLTTAQLLTSEQRRRYAELRGYR